MSAPKLPSLLLLTLVIGTTAIFRLLYANTIGLAPDEAYYWSWSKDLSLVYDHPPLLAWTIKATTLLLGDTLIGVRFSSILASATSIIVVYKICRELNLPPQFSLFAATLATLMPMPATGSILATPDTLCALFWLLTAYFVLRIINTRAYKFWYGIGLCLGLGIMAKHTAFLLLPTVIYTTIITQKPSTTLKTVHPWLSLLLAVGASTPYWATDMSNDFQSALFQLKHLTGGLPAAQAPNLIGFPMRMIELCSGQFALVTPIVSILLIKATIDFKKYPTAIQGLFAFTWIPFIVTMIAAIKTHPEQNWAALGHPLMAIIITWTYYNRAHCNETHSETQSSLAPGGLTAFQNTICSQKFLLAGAIMALAFSIVIHLHTALPFLPLPPQTDPTSRLHGWQSVNWSKQLSADLDGILCDNYGLASQLKWHFRQSLLEMPIIGLDRNKTHIKPGNYLLLDQQNDFAKAKIDFKCKKIETKPIIQMKRNDQKIVREIASAIGTDCKND